MSGMKGVFINDHNEVLLFPMENPSMLEVQMWQAYEILKLPSIADVIISHLWLLTNT